VLTSCNSDDEITQSQETQGYNMLLIGTCKGEDWAELLKNTIL